MTRGKYEIDQLLRHAKARIDINCEDITAKLHYGDYEDLIRRAKEVVADLEAMKELKVE